MANSEFMRQYYLYGVTQLKIGFWSFTRLFFTFFEGTQTLLNVQNSLIVFFILLFNSGLVSSFVEKSCLYSYLSYTYTYMCFYLRHSQNRLHFLVKTYVFIYFIMSAFRKSEDKSPLDTELWSFKRSMLH